MASKDKDDKKEKLVKTERSLRKNIIDFNDQLIEKFPKYTDFLLLRVYLDTTSVDKLMSGCIKFLLPHQKRILEKDEDFFLKGDDMFSQLSPKKVSLFKKIWQSTEMEEDDKDTIWQWFTVIVNLTDKYSKLI